MKNYGVTKNQFIERIMDGDDNAYYRREIVREIISMYHDEMRKALMNGERVTISGIGTIVPNVSLRKSYFNHPSHQDENYMTLPFIDIHINKNTVLKNEINGKLRRNLIRHGKLELSPNLPPLSDTMKAWEIEYVKTHK